MPDVSLDDQCLLAWHIFGEERTRAASQTGKRAIRRRRHLRQAALAKIIRDALIKRGARCGNCASYSQGICLADDCRIHPNDLCTYWKPRCQTT